MTPPGAELEIRPATTADRPAVLSLLGASLGWGSDERFAEFFAWKHDRNPFGPSPALVALDGDRVVGLRTFLRWEFLDADGSVRRAVRAVDTATDPDHQGRGIFRSLTMRALDELAADGVAFVFNTPNTQSRPGYLRMGWVEVGRLPATVRFRSAAAAVRALRARMPAERWSEATSAGRPAEEVLAQPGVQELVTAAGTGPGLRTHRTVAYLRWRYEFAPLGYRALTVSTRVTDGLAVFRLRRRGGALECALCEVLVPGGDAATTRTLLRAVAREARSDYVIRLGGGVLDRAGYLRLPRQGPILTWRPLAATPGRGASLADWDLELGDVELF